MKYAIFTLILLIFTGCLSSPPQESAVSACLYHHEAMPMDTVHSMQYHWDHKEILGSLQLDGAESLDHWELTYGSRENVASFTLSQEQVFEGKSSIKFVSPTKVIEDLGPNGRYWGRQNLTRKFNQEDFSAFNRISFHVYPEFKGFRKLYLTIILHNEGNVPDKYGKEGWHTVMLKNNQWNKMVMEIPHLPHDRVTGITLSYGLQGNEPDASDTITYYVDNLTLEVVEPDYYEGWSTNGEISFSHSGYNCADRKTAFTSEVVGETFRVEDATSKKTVLEKAVIRDSGRRGDFAVFDFSELQKPGHYRIVYGEKTSDPFPVAEDVWLPVIEKITNQFYLQRCGFEQPGIHLKCHTDWYTVHKGDTIVMAGGWHDAGDLSQSYWQTASATAAFFRLARHYEKSHPQLSARLIEEGRWGLDWLNKNRFDSLQVISWTTHDSYTDGIIGNFDDKHIQPGNRASVNDNYHAIIAHVEAALALEKQDPALSGQSSQVARETWDLLAGQPHRWNTERLSLALLAGTRLYTLAPGEKIRKLIVAYADSLMECQQTEPTPWEVPMQGFFYTNRGREQFFGYNHSCVAASPVLGLIELCRLMPDHANHHKWMTAVRLYGQHLKTTAGYTGPYHMIPANIYQLTGTADDAQIVEGVRLDSLHYLRMFPVWHAFRGNSSVMLSPATGLAAAGKLLGDAEMVWIAQAQAEWMQGKNPFSQSLMYGEGYRFSPQYAVFTGDITGGYPVGILTRDDLDVPYWKMAVLHNYKELWGQPAFRMMELLYNLYY